MSLFTRLEILKELSLKSFLNSSKVSSLNFRPLPGNSLLSLSLSLPFALHHAHQLDTCLRESSPIYRGPGALHHQRVDVEDGELRKAGQLTEFGGSREVLHWHSTYRLEKLHGELHTGRTLLSAARGSFDYTERAKETEQVGGRLKIFSCCKGKCKQCGKFLFAACKQWTNHTHLSNHAYLFLSSLSTYRTMKIFSKYTRSPICTRRTDSTT